MQEQEDGFGLVNEKEAARILSVGLGTLRDWRQKKIGPKWRKMGMKIVRYSVEDLRAFANADVR